MKRLNKDIASFIECASDRLYGSTYDHSLRGKVKKATRDPLWARLHVWVWRAVTSQLDQQVFFNERG